MRIPTTATTQAPESVPVLIEPEVPISSLPAEVATAEKTPQLEITETVGTIVLTIPVPGEEAEPIRRPLVAHLFKQWKRYNRGETVDWEDLGLKPLKLTKIRAGTTRLAPQTTY